MATYPDLQEKIQKMKELIKETGLKHIKDSRTLYNIFTEVCGLYIKDDDEYTYSLYLPGNAKKQRFANYILSQILKEKQEHNYEFIDYDIIATKPEVEFAIIIMYKINQGEQYDEETKTRSDD